MIKHYLAAANSCEGFINYFDNINPSNNGLTYILKGGPGTGKSTVMKNFGKYYEDMGYDVEYFYCSSDIDSLDGVRIPKLNIAIVDGTAPHVTEAKTPGIKEKILNVGEFIKPEIKVHKNIINKLLNKKTNEFKLAYLYLNAVSKLINIEKNLVANTVQDTFFDNENYELLSVLNLKSQNSTPSIRNLFESYLSFNGLDFLYTKNEYKKVITLTGDYLNNTNRLEHLKNKLLGLNYNIICFHSVLDPKLIEAIYITQLDTIVLGFDVSKNYLNNFKNKKEINSLLLKAGKHLALAKKYHKKVEEYYIKNMDFDNLKNYVKTHLTN